MVGWQYPLKGHELEQTPGDSEGLGSLACAVHGVAKSWDMTKRLNSNNNEHLGAWIFFN